MSPARWKIWGDNNMYKAARNHTASGTEPPKIRPKPGRAFTYLSTRIKRPSPKAQMAIKPTLGTIVITRQECNHANAVVPDHHVRPSTVGQNHSTNRSKAKRARKRGAVT